MRCNKCSGLNVIKNGMQGDKQRYKCKTCGHTFVSSDSVYYSSPKRTTPAPKPVVPVPSSQPRPGSSAPLSKGNKIAAVVVFVVGGAIAFAILQWLFSAFSPQFRTGFAIVTGLLIATLIILMSRAVIKDKPDNEVANVHPVTTSVSPSANLEASNIELPNLPGCKLRYEYDDVYVAGTQYRDTSLATVGAELTFEPEPENEHDAKAVAIYCNGQHIGYVPNNRLKDMYHDFICKDGQVCGFVNGINADGIIATIGYYS